MWATSRYIAGSVVLAGLVVYHAFSTREQFFPAVVYLASSKIAIAALGNLAFATALCVYKLIIKIFLGTLRDVEVERVNERLSQAIMESCLAMTIFREEFNTSFVAMFVILTFVKTFHWLLQDRVEHIDTMPVVPFKTRVRITAFMLTLLAIDNGFLRYTIAKSLEKAAGVHLLFGFEYIIQTSVLGLIAGKYLMSLYDERLEGRWENKGLYIFYLELITDMLNLVVYIVFFGIVFANYGLPLHLVRDLYWTFKNFRSRVMNFMRYRRVAAYMETRFPDATAEDLARNDGVCIICREDMTLDTKNKKLNCGHVFHLRCLRSWLERQQSCPTCRQSVQAPASSTQQASTPAPPAPAPPAQNQAANDQPPIQAPPPAAGQPQNAAQAAETSRPGPAAQPDQAARHQQHQAAARQRWAAFGTQQAAEPGSSSQTNPSPVQNGSVGASSSGVHSRPSSGRSPGAPSPFSQQRGDTSMAGGVGPGNYLYQPMLSIPALQGMPVYSGAQHGVGAQQGNQAQIAWPHAFGLQLDSQPVIWNLPQWGLAPSMALCYPTVQYAGQEHPHSMPQMSMAGSIPMVPLFLPPSMSSNFGLSQANNNEPRIPGPPADAPPEEHRHHQQALQAARAAMEAARVHAMGIPNPLMLPPSLLDPSVNGYQARFQGLSRSQSEGPSQSFRRISDWRAGNAPPRVSPQRGEGESEKLQRLLNLQGGIRPSEQLSTAALAQDPVHPGSQADNRSSQDLARGLEASKGASFEGSPANIGASPILVSQSLSSPIQISQRERESGPGTAMDRETATESLSPSVVTAQASAHNVEGGNLPKASAGGHQDGLSTETMAHIDELAATDAQLGGVGSSGLTDLVDNQQNPDKAQNPVEE